MAIFVNIIIDSLVILEGAQRFSVPNAKDDFLRGSLPVSHQLRQCTLLISSTGLVHDLKKQASWLSLAKVRESLK